MIPPYVYDYYLSSFNYIIINTNHYINYLSFLSALYGRNNGALIKKLNEDFLNIAPITLLYGDTCSKDEQKRVTSEIRKFYFDDGPIDNSTRFKVIDVSTHSLKKIRILYLSNLYCIIAIALF